MNSTTGKYEAMNVVEAMGKKYFHNIFPSISDAKL